MIKPSHNKSEIRLAGGILLDKSGKILLLHRNKNGKVQWETPGGKVEEAESEEAAALRELNEELGVEVGISKKIGEGDFCEVGQNYHYVWFQVTMKNSKSFFKLEPGFDDYKYLDIDFLKENQQELSMGTKTLLELYFNNKLSRWER